MTKKIFKGIGVDLIGTLLVIVIGFLVVPIYLSFLSIENYGLWLSINALVALIGCLDLGTDQYLIAVAADTKTFKKNEILDSIFLVFIIKSITLIGILIVSYITFIFLGSLIKFNTNLNSTAAILFLFALLNLFIAIIGGSISAILVARQHFSLVNGAAALFNVLSSIGAILLLNFGFGILSLPIALALFTFMQYLYLFLQLKNRYPKLRVHFKPINLSLLREVLKYSFSFHLVKCVYGIFRVQYLLIAMGSILGPAFATSFSVTNRLPSALSSNSMKLATPFFPSLAELFAKGDIDAVQNIFFGMSKVLMRISIFVITMLYCFNQTFVGLWVGNDLYSGNAVMGLILVYTFLYIPMGAFGVVVYASKRFGYWPVLLALEILVTVVLSFELGRVHGAPGVVASFVIGATISQAYLFILVKKELGFNFKNYISAIFSYLFVPSLVTIMGGIVFSEILKVDSWVSLTFAIIGLTLLQLFSREGIKFITSKEVETKTRVMRAFSL